MGNDSTCHDIESPLTNTLEHAPSGFSEFMTQTVQPQASDQLQKLETRLRKAELRASIAEERAKQLENELHGIRQSYSWFLTHPLRAYNPKRIFLFTLRGIGRQILRHPQLVDAIKPHLKAHPWLWEKIKREVVFNHTLNSQFTCRLWQRITDRIFLSDEIPQDKEDKEAGFTLIAFDGVAIYFANGPLADQRGIGRVSRELLTQLKNLAENSVQAENHASSQTIRKIYFYASIHWCPDTLPAPCVVMIHDVIPLLFPNEFPDAIRHTWETRYKTIASQATRIVTISQSSAEDISSTLEIQKDKISLIYNGITELPVSRNSPAPLPENPYLVFLGSHDHHKNVHVVLQALTLLHLQDIHLVMIGDNTGCKDRVKELGLEDRIHFLGRLSDEDTGYVISNSLALVFPSLYEGFGMPPMEAALLGTATICSRRPAMTELLDGVTVFAEPDSPEEWASAIANLRSDAGLKQSIQSRALNHVRSFSWKTSAMRLHHVFHEEAL
uniref:Glycosyl transferase group 1 n=1 Tax=Candidatus Nitrotoga fabula TaxID=2182327 RepID=A0A2X0QWF0_9PROT|nr:protein of unknown function [Candidatus Nitrotoga fabula]